MTVNLPCSRYLAEHIVSASPHPNFADAGNYTITNECYATNPGHSSVYYFGLLYSAQMQTTEGYCRAYIPYTGFIRSYYGSVFVQTTLATGAATAAVYLRLTKGDSGEATDYEIGTVGFTERVNPFSNAGLMIPVSEGDYFEIKMITPDWSVHPTGVYVHGTAYIVATGGETTSSFITASGPLYGANNYNRYGYNITSGPIGGGSGYPSIVTTGDHIITTKAELVAHLSSGATPATSGQTIFVVGTAQIDMSGNTYLGIPSGVRLASDRGNAGSSGALLYHDHNTSGFLPLFRCVSGHQTVTGIRLRGGQSGTEAGNGNFTGIRFESGKYITVTNCEVYNWPFAGITYYYDGISGLSSVGIGEFHHNYFHNCQKTGYGYGLSLMQSTAKIYCNKFDWNRHHVSGERDPLSPYHEVNADSYWNYFEANATNTMYDQHGGNDNPSWGFSSGPDAAVAAGGDIRIHHNTFKSASQAAVGIRGVPRTLCYVYGNWTYWAEAYSTSTFIQRLENIGLTPYQHMTVEDNWYGTTAPPGS